MFPHESSVANNQVRDESQREKSAPHSGATSKQFDCTHTREARKGRSEQHVNGHHRGGTSVSAIGVNGTTMTCGGVGGKGEGKGKGDGEWRRGGEAGQEAWCQREKFAPLWDPVGRVRWPLVCSASRNGFAKTQDLICEVNLEGAGYGAVGLLLWLQNLKVFRGHRDYTCASSPRLPVSTMKGHRPALG